MPRGSCHRHDRDHPCTCAMGHLYRFIEPVVLHLLQKKGTSYGYDLARALESHALTDSSIEKGALYRTLRALEEKAMSFQTGGVLVAGQRGVTII